MNVSFCQEGFSLLRQLVSVVGPGANRTIGKQHRVYQTTFQQQE
jgi:hypothetical protein